MKEPFKRVYMKQLQPKLVALPFERLMQVKPLKHLLPKQPQDLALLWQVEY